MKTQSSFLVFNVKWTHLHNQQLLSFSPKSSSPLALWSQTKDDGEEGPSDLLALKRKSRHPPDISLIAVRNMNGPGWR